MSSAKVPTVTFGACGRSEVNKMYSRGPKRDTDVKIPNDEMKMSKARRSIDYTLLRILL